MVLIQITQLTSRLTMIIGAILALFIIYFGYKCKKYRKILLPIGIILFLADIIFLINDLWM